MTYGILDYALYYASKGWRIFPCKPRDKVPACKWKDEATIDTEKIEHWWKANPEYNLGLKCGIDSGIIVLDVDPDKGGNESLLDLIRDYNPIPTTPEQITGGGGRHFIFAHPGIEIGNSAGKLGPGLDVRGDGGYVVVPPSVHPNGNLYEWEFSCKPSQTILAPMPGWLVGLLVDSQNGNGHHETEEYTGTIQEGERNQALASMAGSMRRRGFDTQAIFAALMEHNKEHCHPPLSNDEVLNIAKSISQYAPTALYRNGRGKLDITAREPLNAIESAYIFLDLLDNLEGRSIPTFITPIDNSLGGLERQTLTILAARPSMGKSTLAWQIARNIASNGLKAYIFTLEMGNNNLWAKAACGSLGLRWRDFRAGNATKQQKDELRIEVKRLMKLYGKNLLMDEGMNTTDTIWQMVDKHRPDLVVVDHLRLVANMDDSEVRRLGYMSTKMKEIAKEFNCSSLVLAQLNRGVENRSNKRPQLADLRESGQIEENADVVLMMYREDYYDDDSPPPEHSKTELLVRKFRDDILSQRVNLTFDTKHQFFGAKQEFTTDGRPFPF